MKKKSILFITAMLLVFNLYAATPDGGEVTAKVSKQIFPTYEMGHNDPNTLFIDYKIA